MWVRGVLVALALALSIIYDPVALRWIRNALGRPGPADTGFRPSCLPL